MVYSLNRKSTGGNAMLKVDMAKAYDRVDWNFLNQVMENFGYSLRVKKLMSKCVETLWNSVERHLQRFFQVQYRPKTR